MQVCTRAGVHFVAIIGAPSLLHCVSELYVSGHVRGGVEAGPLRICPRFRAYVSCRDYPSRRGLFRAVSS